MTYGLQNFRFLKRHHVHSLVSGISIPSHSRYAYPRIHTLVSRIFIPLYPDIHTLVLGYSHPCTRIFTSSYSDIHTLVLGYSYPCTRIFTPSYSDIHTLVPRYSHPRTPTLGIHTIVPRILPPTPDIHEYCICISFCPKIVCRCTSEIYNLVPWHKPRTPELLSSSPGTNPTYTGTYTQYTYSLFYNL